MVGEGCRQGDPSPRRLAHTLQPVPSRGRTRHLDRPLRRFRRRRAGRDPVRARGRLGTVSGDLGDRPDDRPRAPGPRARAPPGARPPTFPLAVEVAFGLSDGGFAIMMRTGAIPVGTASVYVHACDGRVLERKFGPGRPVDRRDWPAPWLPRVSVRGAGGRLDKRSSCRSSPSTSTSTRSGVRWRPTTGSSSRGTADGHAGDSTNVRIVASSSATTCSTAGGGSATSCSVNRPGTTCRPSRSSTIWHARRRRWLFASVAILARRRAKAAVECITLNAGARHQLRLLGFVNRKDASRALRVTVRTQPGEPLRTPLCEPDAFFLTCADSDVDE